MAQDARFEDGADKPLRLKAESPEDLPAVSALAQDAVLTSDAIKWDRAARRFALLLNRFRWEDAPAAERTRRSYERVQSVLAIDSVLSVKRSGFDPRDVDQVISLLGLTFEPAEEGAGRIILTLAGDGAIALDVECVDLTLTDVTRPYRSVSGKVPLHPQD